MKNNTKKESYEDIFKRLEEEWGKEGWFFSSPAHYRFIEVYEHEHHYDEDGFICVFKKGAKEVVISSFFGDKNFLPKDYSSAKEKTCDYCFKEKEIVKVNKVMWPWFNRPEDVKASVCKECIDDYRNHWHRIQNKEEIKKLVEEFKNIIQESLDFSGISYSSDVHESVVPLDESINPQTGPEEKEVIFYWDTAQKDKFKFDFEPHLEVEIRPYMVHPRYIIGAAMTKSKEEFKFALMSILKRETLRGGIPLW